VQQFDAALRQPLEQVVQRVFRPAGPRSVLWHGRASQLISLNVMRSSGPGRRIPRIMYRSLMTHDLHLSWPGSVFTSPRCGCVEACRTALVDASSGANDPDDANSGRFGGAHSTTIRHEAKVSPPSRSDDDPKRNSGDCVPLS